MSILIKGMEMPENCYKCPFAMEYYSTLYMSKAGKFRKDYCCVITHKTLTSTKRNRFCPLVEVPTPHGRLIDADALLERTDYIEAEFGHIHEEIRDMPTVIPASGGDE